MSHCLQHGHVTLATMKDFAWLCDCGHHSVHMIHCRQVGAVPRGVMCGDGRRCVAAPVLHADRVRGDEEEHAPQLAAQRTKR